MPKIVQVVLLGCLLMGCIYVDERGHKGDVEFFWTLNSWQCSADPYVHRIRISIPGESLHNDGIYPCVQGGVEGIVLGRFYPGNYSYTVEALDFQGNLLYSKSGSFYVNGYTSVYVDLVPVLPALRLSWNLVDNAWGAYKCREVDMLEVRVHVDGVHIGNFSCEEGESPRSISISGVRPGVALSVEARVRGSTSFRYTGHLPSLSYGAQHALLLTLYR